MLTRIPDSMLVNPGGNMKVVASIADLKDVDPSDYTLIFLNSGDPVGIGQFGTFVWKTGNYSSHITAQTVLGTPYEGMVIASNLIASTVGAWVRITDGYSWHTNWFNPPSSSAADASPMITAMINVGAILFPKFFNVDGFHGLDAQLPTISWPTLIRGLWFTTGFLKRYNASAANRGILHWDAQAPNVEGITLLATAGTPGAGFSGLPTTDANLQKNPTLERCHVSGGSFLNFSLYLNGQQITGGAGTIGYRNLFINNCQFFGVSNADSGNAAVYMKDVKHGAIQGMHCMQSGGTSGNAMIMSGSTSGAGGSVDIGMSGMTWDGDVTIEQTDDINMTGDILGTGAGAGNLTFSTGAARNAHIGKVAGTFTQGDVTNTSYGWDGVAN